jgi:hypothetical protein
MAKITKEKTTITKPELALVAATRMLLGFGVGLLLAERFSADRRKTIGRRLLGLGALSTIPLGLRIFGYRFRKENEPPLSRAA